ncbi:MAG: anti-sigma factor [Saprospiraceae bacterium]|nr:anti-sigma factor [Saprospiraceae bacterium]MBP7679796.1 anti-sigma factor [Saprospiraceae bacterium]
MKLEKFVHTHREKFDSIVPAPPALWERIEQQLPPQQAAGDVIPVTTHRVTHIWRHWQSIAAAVALLIIGIAVGQQFTNHPEKMPAQFAEATQYYEQKTEQKMATLASYSPQAQNMVAGDLQCIDSMMLDLKQELANTTPENRERVIHALIQNYKSKVAILERVLEKVQTLQPTDSTVIRHKKSI